MESEEDMHDANDAESLDYDFYSGETAMDSDDADADYEFIDNDSDDSDDLVSHRSQQNYTILNEAEIHQRQEEDMMKISTILSISRVSAGILLRHYNWDVSKVNDEWFADEEKVRRAVGLLEEAHTSPNAKELTCGICFEVYPCDRMSSAACGHPFCVTCWQGYISTAINDGPGCLMLRCPDPSCGAAVGEDMINALASIDDREKYRRYFLRSFVEDNKKAYYSELSDQHSVRDRILDREKNTEFSWMSSYQSNYYGIERLFWRLFGLSKGAFWGMPIPELQRHRTALLVSFFFFFSLLFWLCFSIYF